MPVPPHAVEAHAACSALNHFTPTDRFEQPLSTAAAFQPPAMSRRRLISRWTLILAALLALDHPLHAAPATSEELRDQHPSPGTEPPSRSAQTTPSPTGAPGATPQSRTVELLLQMQDQGLSSNPQVLKGEATDRKLPTAGRKPEGDGQTDSANPFSNLSATMGEVKAPSREGGSETAGRSDAGGVGSGSGPRDSGSTGAGSSQARESLLANPVVRFIRENRNWIIGVGVVLLIGVGLAASTVRGTGRR